MVKFLFYGVVIYFLYRMFVGDKKQRQKEAQKERETLIARGEMVKDPVCGSYVALDNAVRTNNNGEIVHFCSYECRDKYLKQIEASGNTKDKA